MVLFHMQVCTIPHVCRRVCACACARAGVSGLWLRWLTGANYTPMADRSKMRWLQRSGSTAAMAKHPHSHRGSMSQVGQRPQEYSTRSKIGSSQHSMCPPRFRQRKNTEQRGPATKEPTLVRNCADIRKKF